MQNKPKKWLEVGSLDGKEWRDFPASRVADATGYDLRTVNSWCDGRPIPAPARKLLAMVMLGCLPDDEWSFWRARGRYLHNLDSGSAYDARALEQDWLTWQRLAETQRENQELKAANAALQSQMAQMARERRCLSSWHQRRPSPPLQHDLFDFSQAQKSPA